MPALDQRVFAALNADHGLPWLDNLAALFSSFDFWLPFMVLAGILIAWRGGFRARAMLICLLLSIAIIEGLFDNPLKHAIGRPRPLDSLDGTRIVRLARTRPAILAISQPAQVKIAKVSGPPEPGKSFPSGHTANMFCFATVLAAFYGRRGALFFIIATLVGLSRVITGSHWPTDVFFTALLAIPLTLLLLRLYALAWQKFAPRIVPALAARHPELIPPAA